MAGPELALALVGVVAWGRLLGALGSPRSLFRLVAESVAVHTVGSTLLSVGLVSCGAFRPSLAQSLAAAIPLGLLLWRRPRWPGRRGCPLVTQLELIVVLVLVAVAPVALPRMEPLRIVDDADVYSNAAIHHLHAGSLVGTVPVRDRLQGDLLAAFDRDNLLQVTSHRAHYLPGTYVFHRSDFVFQGYPGWPMLMAQWGGLFGLSRIFYSVLFAFSMAVVFFGFLLQAAGLRPATFTLTVALFASSPLLLFFSKYTTSEAFLLFLFLFVLYFLGEEGVHGTALAASGFLAIVVTHVSTLLYSPLVLLVALEAYRSRSRKLASFSVAAFGALLVGLPLGFLFSPVYVQDIYRSTFTRAGFEDPVTVGLVLTGAAYAAGLVFSALALRRALGGTRGGTPAVSRPSGGRHLLQTAIRVALLATIAWTLYRGYQLGWTDYFARHSPGGGAWASRQEYSGGGWTSLAHLNMLSMAMATSLVGLPLVLGLAFWRGGTVCATSRRRFLLAAALLPVAIHTFIRADIPFNYYPSRYFIPVLVPAVMLLFGEMLAVLRVRTLAIVSLALLGFAFNLRSDYTLYRYPARNDQLRFVSDVARRVGNNRVLFIRNAKRNDREMLLLLGLPLVNAWNISVVNVVGTPEMPADDLIARYARRLKLRDAAVLTRDPPSAGYAFETVVLTRRRLMRHLVFLTDAKEWRLRLHLRNVSFRR